jgi:hypothetical protein
MSRSSSLWAAGAVALLFALIVGAVLLKPMLTVNADTPAASGRPAVVGSSDDDTPAWWDDDDDEREHEDDDEKYEEDEHEDENEHEDDD